MHERIDVDALRMLNALDRDAQDDFDRLAYGHIECDDDGWGEPQIAHRLAIRHPGPLHWTLREVIENTERLIADLETETYAEFSDHPDMDCERPACHVCHYSHFSRVAVKSHLLRELNRRRVR